MREASPSRPIARRRAAGGFTLIELLVTLVISSVVVSAAVAGIVALNEQALLLKRRAELESEAKILTEVLVSDLQAVGGGSFRPWSVVTVNNNVAGGGSDELTILEVVDTLGECAIEEHPGTGNVLKLARPDGVCCLLPDPSLWENRVILAVNGNGAVEAKLQSNNSNAGGQCQLNFNPNPPGDDLEGLPGTERNLEGGALAAVSVRRYRVDHTRNVLILDVDENGDGVFEEHVIADRVYDLQVALGYDTNQDRKIRSDGTAGDEFLFNHPSDRWGSGGLTGARETQLRLVQIGLVTGVPFPKFTTSAQSLDGPVRTESGVLLRATHGRAFLRNLSLYDQ